MCYSRGQTRLINRHSLVEQSVQLFQHKRVTNTHTNGRTHRLTNFHIHLGWNCRILQYLNWFEIKTLVLRYCHIWDTDSCSIFGHSNFKFRSNARNVSTVYRLTNKTTYKSTKKMKLLIFLGTYIKSITWDLTNSITCWNWSLGKNEKGNLRSVRDFHKLTHYHTRDSFKVSKNQ